MLEKTLNAEISEISQGAIITNLLFQIRQLRLQNKVLLKKNCSLEKDLRQQKFQIKQLTQNLSRINTEINEEMEIAKRILEGLMSKTLPEMANLDSAAVYIPTNKVGGDLYDILGTSSQKIAILIFDVSGHGIPAALVGAMSKMLFAHFIEKTESPAEVFRLINKKFCSLIKTEQYLTAFLGIFDPVKNTLTYSRAGHVPPLVYRKKEQKVISLDFRGFFIGHSALENLAEYWEQTINLEPGDKILFYTDGLTEGRNSSGALYGNERLRTVYSKCAEKNLHDVLESIVSDQANFRNGMPLRDDFTLLCIELKEN
jgi:sigma-B regulation protein RsbU (phosphoserine phosphatase)